MPKLFTAIAAATGLLLIAVGVGSSPADAACGKECKQAKSFCKSHEQAHPNEECGVVRGAICTGSSWTKINQVNWAWSACRLGKGGADLKKAEAHCKEYKDNWGGKCEVHSPLCNLGWVKLADYGKFRACRPIEITANMRYNAYKAFMRKFEGKADTKMAPVLADFVKKHYDLDLASIRWGYASNTPSTCIADCTKIYCNKQSVIDQVKSGVVTSDIVFHELQHAQQCKKKGGRDDYAKLWFGNLPKGFFGALNPELDGKFKDKVHDMMPMEQDAAAKATKVMKTWTSGWWHAKAKCRVYKSDRKTVVYTSNDTHPRFFCDPELKGQGVKTLEDKADDAARKHGYGTYHFAFGKPDEGNGVWLGSVKAGTDPVLLRLKAFAALALASGERASSPASSRSVRTIRAAACPRTLTSSWRGSESYWTSCSATGSRCSAPEMSVEMGSTPRPWHGGSRSALAS